MSRMLNLSTCLMLRTVESTALTRCDGVPQVTTQNVACGVEGTSCSRKLEITYAGVTIKLIRGLGIQVGNKTYPDDVYLDVAGIISIYPTTLYTVVVFDGVTIYWSGGERGERGVCVCV